MKILDFYSLNRAQYPIYDETLQSRSLLEGKNIELHYANMSVQYSAIVKTVKMIFF